MEISITVSAICLLIFGSVGIVDGAYFHIWKFKLFAHAPSIREHLTHSFRSLFFTCLLYLLYMNNFQGLLLWLGAAVVVADLVVLMIDLFSEEDSRRLLGGIPRAEYIIHVVANGFHLASLALILAAKPQEAWLIDAAPISSHAYPAFVALVAKQLLPGAIVLAALHFLLMIPAIRGGWLRWQAGLIARFGPKLDERSPG